MPVWKRNFFLYLCLHFYLGLNVMAYKLPFCTPEGAPTLIWTCRYSFCAALFRALAMVFNVYLHILTLFNPPPFNKN